MKVLYIKLSDSWDKPTFLETQKHEVSPKYLKKPLNIRTGPCYFNPEHLHYIEPFWEYCRELCHIPYLIPLCFIKDKLK